MVGLMSISLSDSFVFLALLLLLLLLVVVVLVLLVLLLPSLEDAEALCNCVKLLFHVKTTGFRMVVVLDELMGLGLLAMPPIPKE